MAAVVEGEQDLAVRAALILVSLQHRKLREFPEWVPMPSGEASWPKRPRSGRPRSRGDWMVALVRLKHGLSAAFAGSDASSSEEEREHSPASPPPRGRAWPAAGDALLEAAVARWPVDANPDYGAPARSGPSTSAVDCSARAQPRPRHSVEKAAAQVVPASDAAPPKQHMDASSPETPLDFGAGGSGASSSLDDASRPQPKRKGQGARGSGGGAWSGDDDEGCSSPAKRARVADAEAAVEEKAIPVEPRAQSEPSADGRDEDGVLPFDLNVPWPDPDCSDNS